MSSPDPTAFQKAKTPYLSVVVTSRNDDHGGDPLMRLQAFINCFDAQCRRTGLDAELIVVEWNPPCEKPRLQTLVRIPEPCFCTYRFLDVPPELHRTLRYSDVLPLFQMIAKNVGIRRARGRFVLATNIDIIFSNELIDYLASGQLEAGYMYRVDRHDIQSAFPTAAPLDAQMAYCADHHLRVHTRWGSYTVDASGRMVHTLEDIVSGPALTLGSGWHVREGTATTGFYRWASDRAQVHIDRTLDPNIHGGHAALDIELEPNHPLAWVDIEVVDESGTVLRRARINKRRVVRVAVDPNVDRGTLELRVVATPSDARRRLEIFERRGSMHYRVRSLNLRRVDQERDRFRYPAAGWRAVPGVTLLQTAGTEALSVVTRPQRWSYCLEYGPLRPSETGSYDFAIAYEIDEGAVSLGILKDERQSWALASVSDVIAADGLTLTASAHLVAGELFFLMVTNDHPNGDGISRFIVKELTGSVDLARLLPASASPSRWQALKDLRRLVVTKAR